MMDDDDYLPAVPGTYIEFRINELLRDRPCWRCRLHLRWPPWRKHWQCMMGPKLTYLDS